MGLISTRCGWYWWKILYQFFKLGSIFKARTTPVSIPLSLESLAQFDLILAIGELPQSQSTAAAVDPGIECSVFIVIVVDTNMWCIGRWADGQRHP